MESSTNLQTETSSTEETKMRELKNTEFEDVAGGWFGPIGEKLRDYFKEFFGDGK